MALLRLAGWLPVSFGTQYAVVVAMALEVPLLMVALNIRLRERHGAHISEIALSSQDALTGLLAPHGGVAAGRAGRGADRARGGTGRGAGPDVATHPPADPFPQSGENPAGPAGARVLARQPAARCERGRTRCAGQPGRDLAVNG